MLCIAVYCAVSISILRYNIPSEEQPWFKLGAEAWDTSMETQVEKCVLSDTCSLPVQCQEEDETAETMEKWLSQARCFSQL